MPKIAKKKRTKQQKEQDPEVKYVEKVDGWIHIL